MSDHSGSHSASHRTTSQLLVALLTGNLFAILCIPAFSPFSFDQGSNLVLTVGEMSLVATGLLFLAWAMERDTTPWRVVAVMLNVAQIARLIPGVIVIGTWTAPGEWTGVVWAILFVPFLAVLSAVGLVMTVLEARRVRRRRFARA